MTTDHTSITSMKSWFYPVNGKSKHMICLNYGEWDECCSHCYEAWCKYSKHESWAYFDTSQPKEIPNDTSPNSVPDKPYTITEEPKMYYIKCNLPTECENLSKGMYCPDKCKIEGCIRDSSNSSKNEGDKDV